MAWMWWLGGALILGVVEMLTVDLVFVMFAGGALAAMIVALLGLPAWAQVLTFALVSWALLQVARPTAKAWIEASTPDTKTNVDALIGRRARVTQDFEPELRLGRVAIDGDDWRAECTSDRALHVGDLVDIVRVESNTLVVKPAEP